MKHLVEEVNGEGLEGLIGRKICVWCLNYIYHGKLIGVNATDIKLSEAKIIYETGELKAQKFSDAQCLPNEWYIRVSAIESYGEVNHD